MSGICILVKQPARAAAWTNGERVSWVVTVGYEVTEEIHKKIRHAAMAGVFDLGNVLELVDHRFDHHAFSQ
jgi:hypothetical protein